jgi:hypothetical protein
MPIEARGDREFVSFLKLYDEFRKKWIAAKGDDKGFDAWWDKTVKDKGDTRPQKTTFSSSRNSSRLSRLCDVELARVGLAEGESYYVKSWDGEQTRVQTATDKDVLAVLEKMYRAATHSAEEPDDAEAAAFTDGDNQMVYWLPKSHRPVELAGSKASTSLSSLCDRELQRVGLAEEDDVTKQDSNIRDALKEVMSGQSLNLASWAKKIMDRSDKTITMEELGRLMKMAPEYF